MHIHYESLVRSWIPGCQVRGSHGDEIHGCVLDGPVPIYVRAGTSVQHLATTAKVCIRALCLEILKLGGNSRKANATLKNASSHCVQLAAFAVREHVTKPK